MLTICKGVIGAQLSSYCRLIGVLLYSRKDVRECYFNNTSLSGKDFVLVKRNHLYLPDRVCRLVPHCFFLRLTKQRSSAHRSAFSIHHSSRKVLSSAVSHGGSGTVQASACLRPPVLDESLIREQTKVDHFWGELSLVMSPVVLRRRGVVASLSLCPFLVGAAQGTFEAFL